MVSPQSVDTAASPLWLSRNDDDDGIFYDDFDEPIGGGNADENSLDSSNVLQNRLNQLTAREQESLIRVSENWKQGFWSVRGCSLDRGDKEFGEKGVGVSSMLPLEDETVLVGRTDGSICWLQIGSEYLATFTNRLSAKPGANDTISIGEELQRDELASVPMPRGDPASPASAEAATRFEILGQIQAASGSILDMAIVGADPSHLFILSDSPLEPLRVLAIQEDGPVNAESFSLPTMPEMTPMMAVRPIRDNLVLSISQSGMACLWSTNSLIHSFQVSIQDDTTILCMDTDDNFVYIGTSSGSVLIYAVDHVLGGEEDATALKTFSSFDNAGVSTIYAAGEGVMGQGRSTHTLALITGSTDGCIKQWELLPRGSQSVEYWPKLASQTMPGKAHLLQGATEESPILDLKKVQEGIVLSASQGELTIWDSATGKALSTMPGLNFDRASCCVLSQHLLVTNGMNQYVCVHDFSIDPNLEVKDMLVPMDDEDE